MTEYEAIEVLKEKYIPMSIYPNNRGYKRHNKAISKAISALEEIRQYRALGTVEKLREAREKQKAKKPFIQRTDEKALYKCPCCKKVFVEAYENLQRGYIPKYCEMCGPSIDF